MPRPDQAAADLLEQLDITEPPVPVDEVAQRLGLTVVRGHLRGDISGMLYREGGRSVIGLNSSQHRLRQRFTVAHELGHYKLHPGQAAHIDRNVRVNFRDIESGRATRWDEIEANAFAAELLMPRAMVQRAVRQAVDAGITQESRLVADLSTQFEVSRQAMEFRLVNLGVIHPPV